MGCPICVCTAHTRTGNLSAAAGKRMGYSNVYNYGPPKYECGIELYVIQFRYFMRLEDNAGTTCLTHFDNYLYPVLSCEISKNE